MHLSGLDLVLWVTPLAGHFTLLCVLLLKRRANCFPAFAALIMMNVVRTLILFFVFRHGAARTYFDVYWLLAVLDALLQIAVAYEVAYRVFRPVQVWALGVGSRFAWLLFGSTAVACALSWLAAPSAQGAEQTLVMKGNFFSSVLLGELFVGMVVLSATMGLPWRTHTARIAQGLGLYAIAGIVIHGLQTYFGRSTQTYATLNHLRIEIYLTCLAYWCITLAQETPETRKLPGAMHQQLWMLSKQAAADLESLRSSGRQR